MYFVKWHVNQFTLSSEVVDAVLWLVSFQFAVLDDDANTVWLSPIIGIAACSVID